MNIKQRIQTKRGEYTQKRKKKFQYLKNTGQMENYISQRFKSLGTSPMLPITQSTLSANWFQRFWNWIINFFKRNKNAKKNKF